MLIVKDQRGKVYVARVNSPKDRYTPGAINEWFFLGPGTDAFITWMSGTKYLLVFKYLAGNFVRVLDAAVWPPLQVDPVTSYSPLTLQRPESWLPAPFQQSITTALTGPPAETVKPTREDPYIRYDVGSNTYTVTLGRDTATTPVNALKYRLYSRDIGTTPWTLSVDWADTVTGYKVITPTPTRKEFQMTWGNLWAPGFQNYPMGSHPMEYLPGEILRIDGLTESLVINLEVEVEVPVVNPSETEAFAGLYSEVPRFYFLSGDETEIVPLMGANLSTLQDPVYHYQDGGGFTDSVSLPQQMFYSISTMGF